MSVVPYRGGAQSAAIINVGADDPFEIAFRPAKPVLDAIVEMRKPLAWLNQQRRSGRPIFDPSRAVEPLQVNVLALALTGYAYLVRVAILLLVAAFSLGVRYAVRASAWSIGPRRDKGIVSNILATTPVAPDEPDLTGVAPGVCGSVESTPAVLVAI
jgi:hypothetical protein